LKFEGKADIAIIGGTGSDIELEDSEEVKIYTPYGNTSDFIEIGDFQGKRVAFIPRHGKGHTIPPHLVNCRANIWALKSLGAKHIISPSAVGSLTKDLDKKCFVLIDQYIDRTKKRFDTFYEGGQVCHIGQADPFCEYLNEIFYQNGKVLGLKIRQGGTYICIEGPRFSTRSESKMFRQWGGDVIGMTLYPEVALAAEKEICYCAIAMVTDLDVWAARCDKCGVVEFGKSCPKCGGPINKLAVTIDEVLDTMETNAAQLRNLLKRVLPKIDTNRDCNCHHTLSGAII
jgi:5'-methylthioadenosine phosphorylase